MKERPILYRAEMVRAILEGRKTKTRRIVKPQPIGLWSKDLSTHAFNGIVNGPHGAKEPPKDHYWLCPYGQPGDRLWVRETFQCDDYRYPQGPTEEMKKALMYRASDPDAYVDEEFFWRPSIHMPRWASRIDLEITEVRVERLQDISEADAMAEGVFKSTHDNYFHSTIHPIKGTYQCWISARQAFEMLWKSINGPDSWAANPWVWVISFERLKP